MVTHGDDPAEMQCGLPLVLLWALQLAIDEGRLTTAEACEMITRAGHERPRPDPATA